MTVVSTKRITEAAHIPGEGRTEPSSAKNDVPHDPTALRAELGEKRKLLNLLESQGVRIAHADEIRAQVEAALKDLDSIIDETV